MSEYSIGQEIEAHCGKCKDDTIHVITSLADEKIEKLMCKTCNAYHRFKKPKGQAQLQLIAATVEAKSKPVKTAQRRTRRDKWTRLLDDMASDTAIDYKMDINYDLATAINHKTFGLGVVKSIIDSRKIEVLFHDGERILVQNYVS